MRIRFGDRRVASRGASAEPTNVFGKLGMTLFFLLFFLAGIAFSVFLGVEFFRNLRTYAWPAANATITRSEIVRDDAGAHHFEVGYEYAVDGDPYAAESYNNPRRPGYTNDDYAVLQRLACRYPVGAECTAYYDPSDPSRAVLIQPSLWVGTFVFLPLLFVAIGAGGVYFTWFSNRGGVPSIANRVQSKGLVGKWILRVLGIIFTSVGLLVLHSMFIGPVLRVQRAKSWSPVPATVVASRVVTHRGDDSTTYSIDILYKYEIDGRNLRSNRYDFLSGSSSGRRAKQAIVDAHPPGEEITVYVNPADPFDAVLHRGYPDALWFGLIPLVFCLAGLAMLIGSRFVPARPHRAGGDAWLPAAATVDPADARFAGRPRTAPSRVTLRPIANVPCPPSWRLGRRPTCCACWSMTCMPTRPLPLLLATGIWGLYTMPAMGICGKCSGAFIPHRDGWEHKPEGDWDSYSASDVATGKNGVGCHLCRFAASCERSPVQVTRKMT